MKNTVMHRIKYLIGLIMLSLLTACGDGVQVRVEFNSSQNIKEGVQVFYQGDVVGEVDSYEKNAQGSSVVLTIDKDAADTIDPNSAVVVNQIKPGAPLEIHPSLAPVEGGISDGQTLKGLDSMFDLVAWSMGDVFKATSSEINAYANEFSNYLESDKFKQDKATIEQGMVDMANSASAAMKAVEQDLADAMTDIDVTEEELVAAIESLGDDLAPLAKEMAKNGTDLMLELEKFAEGLESGSLEEQESGQRLIESMLAAIERLNESAEQGVDESLESQQ